MTIRLKDSVIVKFTRSDINGFFLLDSIPEDTMLMSVLHPKYGSKNFFILGNSSTLDFKNIYLETAGNSLGEIMIVGKRKDVFIKGDTIIYNVENYSVTSDATIRDLLNKMPGISVDDAGNIDVFGNSVHQIFIDGEEFFGSNPELITNGLNAKVVDKVKVYEKENSDNQNPSSSKQKILDIKLKKEYAKGVFGKSAVSTDFKKYHFGEFLLNAFNDTSKISVFGLISTTPISNFDNKDIQKFGLVNQSSEITQSDGTNQVLLGVPKTFSAGMYYSDKFGRKKNTSLLFDYSYSKFLIEVSKSEHTDYFLSLDSSYSIEKINLKNYLNESHKLHLVLSQQIDSLTVLVNRFGIDFMKNSNNGITDYNIMNNNLMPNFYNTQVQDLKLNSFQLSNSLFLLRKFSKRNREFSLLYNIYSASNLEDRNLETINVQGNLTDSKNIHFKNHEMNLKNFARIAFKEPIGKKIILTSEIDLDMFSFNKDVNTTIDNLYNSSMSGIFRTRYIQNRFTSKATYAVKKNYVEIELRYRNLFFINTLKDSLLFKKGVNNVFPKISFTYKISTIDRIQLEYSTESDLVQPYLLNPTINNTDPNFISIGNPKLLPSYANKFKLNFVKWNLKSNNNANCNINADATQNSIGFNKVTDSIGRYIYNPINVNWVYKMGFDINATANFFNQYFSITSGYSHQIQTGKSIINGKDFNTLTSIYKPSLSLGFYSDSLEIILETFIEHYTPRIKARKKLISIQHME